MTTIEKPLKGKTFSRAEKLLKNKSENLQVMIFDYDHTYRIKTDFIFTLNANDPNNPIIKIGDLYSKTCKYLLVGISDEDTDTLFLEPGEAILVIKN